MELAQTMSFSGQAITFTPLSLAVLFLGMGVVLFGRRAWVLPTFLAISVLMSMALHVILLGQNFMVYRILLLVAWCRIISRGEHRGLNLSAIDKAFILLNAWMVVAEIIRTGFPGVIYGVSNYLYDALGTYFLCRIMIQDRKDLQNAVTSLLKISMVLAAFMCVEFVTHRNWLSLLGAVQDMQVEREGHARCAGSFLIAITAGTFGAVLLPLFLASWWPNGRTKRLAILGCFASTIITIAAGSAGPLGTYAAGILGMFAWRARHRMKMIRWAVLVSLVTLHLVMKAPVWALVARIQIVPGASAWHRFNVLDGFIRNVDKWWLVGVNATEDWGWFVDDVANQFCIMAKHGGMLGLVLFIRVIVLGFREVGIRVRENEHDRPTALMIWAFGVLLFGHITSFFGISYFDQTKLIWYLTLAMIASVHLLATAPEPAVVEEEETQPHAVPLTA